MDDFAAYLLEATRLKATCKDFGDECQKKIETGEFVKCPYQKGSNCYIENIFGTMPVDWFIK